MKKVVFTIHIDGETQFGSVLLDAEEHLIRNIFNAMFPNCNYCYHEEIEP